MLQDDVNVGDDNMRVVRRLYAQPLGRLGVQRGREAVRQVTCRQSPDELPSNAARSHVSLIYTNAASRRLLLHCAASAVFFSSPPPPTRVPFSDLVLHAPCNELP